MKHYANDTDIDYTHTGVERQLEMLIRIYMTYFSCPKTIPGFAAVRPSYMCKSLQ
jgi:hypothetical protein